MTGSRSLTADALRYTVAWVAAESPSARWLQGMDSSKEPSRLGLECLFRIHVHRRMKS
jgi:hypothetical protein